MVDRGYGIEIEDTYGDTTVTKSNFAPEWWSEAESVDFKLNDEPVTKSGGSRMNKRARAGVIKPTGSTKAEADLQRLTYYFYGFLDNYTYTAGTSNAPNIHEFYGGEGKELPSFRGVAVFDMLKKYIYGMLEDGLKLECSNDSLSVEADWIYKTEKAGIIGQSGETFTRPDDLDDDLFIMFYDISLKLNNAALDGVSTSFSFDGKNNHDVDATIGFGSRAPQVRALAGKREIDLEIKTTLTSDTVRSILNAEYGEVNALEPSACKILQVPLEVNIALCEISGVACKIVFPKCTIRAEYDMSGSDNIEVTMNLATLGSGTVTLADNSQITTDMYVKLTNGLDELEAKE